MNELERIIVNVSGEKDWRPLFVLGLESAVVIVFLIGVVIGAVLWMRKP